MNEEDPVCNNCQQPRSCHWYETDYGQWRPDIFTLAPEQPPRGSPRLSSRTHPAVVGHGKVMSSDDETRKRAPAVGPGKGRVERGTWRDRNLGTTLPSETP
jgi:hypothetical protein